MKPNSVSENRQPPRVRGRQRNRLTSPSRETILEAARRLYAGSTYAGVTMRSVAKEVGCRSPSLYYYFKSKDDIFRALVDAGVCLYEQFLPTAAIADPLDRLWWRFWRYYEFSKAHKEYFRLLFVERSSPVGDSMLRARVLGGVETAASVEACVKAGLLPPGIDPSEVAVVLCSAIHGATVVKMPDTPPVWRDDLAATTLRLAFDGVRAGLLQPLAARGASGIDRVGQHHLETNGFGRGETPGSPEVLQNHAAQAEALAFNDAGG